MRQLFDDFNNRLKRVSKFGFRERAVGPQDGAIQATAGQSCTLCHMPDANNATPTEAALPQWLRSLGSKRRKEATSRELKSVLPH